MGLLDGVDLTGGIEEAERRQKPLCNPCREGDCARCPTVLAANGIFESDFKCRCHAENPEAHEVAFDDRQEELHERRDLLEGIAAAEEMVAWERTHPWWDEL